MGGEQFSGSIPTITECPLWAKTVREYIHRPEFEFFRIDQDPHESTNLADNRKYAKELEQYKELLKNKTAGIR